MVFALPGLETDTRLEVFGVEVHVSSIIPKLGSKYFRKFLDSADKVAPPASSPFRYEYVTVVDDDGTWGLEAALKVRGRYISPYPITDADDFGGENPRDRSAHVQKYLC